MPNSIAGSGRISLLSGARRRLRDRGRDAFALAAALALAAAPAIAAMYKWTDANGRVVYSDQPPPPSVKVEALAAPPPPANPNAAKELAAKEAEVQQRRTQRADDEAKAAKKGTEQAMKREQCGNVRGQVAMMKSDPNLLYRANDRGQPVYLDDAGRRREIQKLEVWIRENCAN